MKVCAWVAALISASLTCAATSYGAALADTPGQAAPPIAFGTTKRCMAYSGLPDNWKRDPYAGMVRLEGGAVELGTTKGYPDERPRRRPKVKPFWIDRTEVTNAQFATFTKETGYVTEAERDGGAAVFRSPRTSPAETRLNSWWHHIPGANWRHPEGPQSDLQGRANHPVVHITYADALAYARWLGRQLPTEAQWEYAAKAHRIGEALDRAPRDAGGRPAVNFWQGHFPYKNTREDGFARLAPVGCYGANDFGLFDMIGNVWEWTQDSYAPSPQKRVSNNAASRGVRTRNIRMVIKGGSFLCSADFCARYRAAARYPHESNLPIAHVGFRTVKTDD